jgi:hypothetical protein
MSIITIHDLVRAYDQYKRLTISNDWRKKAKCIGEDVDVFINTKREDEATVFCRECHVRDQCLAYSVQTPNLAGVYGGLAETTRDRAYRLHLGRKK